MQISRTEGFLPVQPSAPRAGGTAAGDRVRAQEGCYDQFTLSAAPREEEGQSFRAIAADLARQVRTHNTTGKIQELRRQVQAGDYQVSPREIAARMLLAEAGE